MAGKDNDSSGFRTNFNLIKSAMLAIDSTVSNLVTRIGALSATTVNVNAPLVTATHIIAINDITVGGTNTITTGDNFSTVITANGQSGSIAMLPASFTVVATSATTVSPTQIYANSFGVVDASKIVVGATFQYGPANTRADNVGKTQTVASIDYTKNIITAVNTASLQLFNPGDTIKFTNPFISGVTPGATQTDLTNAINALNNTFINSTTNIQTTIGTVVGDTYANVAANGSTYNAYGKRTVSTSAPSGGNNGDIWYRV